VVVGSSSEEAQFVNFPSYRPLPGENVNELLSHYNLPHELANDAVPVIAQAGAKMTLALL
jgi:hypothetical protein